MAESIDILEDKEKYLHNPFIATLNIKERTEITKIAETNKRIFDMKRYEAEDVKVVFAAERTLDKSPYVKMFDKFLTVAPCLTKAGFRLLCFILLSKIRYDDDKAILEPKECMNRANLGSDSIFYSCIREMILLNIIRKSTVNHVYWINPSFFYRGERRHLVYRDSIDKKITQEIVDKIKEDEKQLNGSSKEHS